MKKIIKIVKNNMIGFTVGVVIAIAISTYAASQLGSGSVYYDNTNSGGSSNTVSGAIDELYDMAATHCPDGYICGTMEELLELLALKVNVGDYISMTPISTSFTTDTAKTGYTSSQTINPSELNLWRVIRVNSDGTVDMVSESVSSVSVCFRGTTGYGGISYLNTIANQYENSNYTISSRHIDYTTYYKLVNTALGTLVANKIGTTTATAYWLKSSFSYRPSTTTTIIYHYARYIGSNGSVSQGNLYASNGNQITQYSICNAVRPILTLKSGVKASSGDGSSASPYVLG